MSLFIFDLAYLGTKSVFNLSYYVLKGTYNIVAGLTGYDPIVEPLTEQEVLLQEMKGIREELKIMKESIRDSDTHASTTSEPYDWISDTEEHDTEKRDIVL
jgi:hypothetical protein